MKEQDYLDLCKYANDRFLQDIIIEHAANKYGVVSAVEVAQVAGSVLLTSLMRLVEDFDDAEAAATFVAEYWEKMGPQSGNVEHYYK